SLVAFSYQGDIWTVSAKGGKATRLTIHEAYESNPIFSPDGSKIAFTGARFGNNDIYTISIDGGVPNRLTYHSGGETATSWNHNDKIFFSTNREFRQLERPSEIYTIHPNGGTESRYLDALGYEPALSPDGRFLAFVRGDINPVARKAYTGSSARKLWIYDTQKKSYHKIEGFKTNDVMPKWANNNMLYFLSSTDGEYNLYSININNKDPFKQKPERLTNFKDESIRHYDISGDGSTIVFEQNMDLYTMKAGGGSVSRLSVNINADERFDPTENKTFTTGASQYALSPNGKYMAFSIRGEIFVKEADKEKSKSINVSNHPYRDINPEWLNDTTLLYTSDRNDGNFDIYMVQSADTSQVNIFKSLKHNTTRLTNTPDDETSLTVSNDGKSIAYTRGRGTLIVASIDQKGKLSNEKVLSDSWASANGVMWSPDDKYLAYSMTDLYYNQEVYIQRADGTGTPVNVSMHPRRDAQPFWSADGSKLGFISTRAVSRSADVYFVWLKKEDWEKTNSDWSEDDSNTKETPKGNEKKGAKKEIIIDFEGIHNRIVQVTNFPGDESDLIISKDGETFYYTANTSTARGRDLYSIKWDGKNLKEITKGGTSPFGLISDREGKYIYYARGGSISRIDSKSGVSESLPFVAKMKIDYEQERTQVFEEAWRTIRDGFYDPKFHGYNWDKLGKKYKDRCVSASTNNDFRDMFNLLLGELNSSHMGLTVDDRAETQRESTGLLGVEISPMDDGLIVKKVIPETPADKTKSKLNVDDKIIAINGKKVTKDINVHALLNGMVNENIFLNVKNKNGDEREVVIRPTSNIGGQLYQEWVDNRKKLVDEYSKGRIGYIHIQGMNFESFEVVEREFMAAGYGKEAVVIDVRYNGGGSTTDYLMTILNYKQHAYAIPRGATDDLEKNKLKFRDYYPIGERLVYAAWTKPSIALCNEGSYSNAEIFSHAYKTLGIGTLVGLPTNGSVISTGGKGLMDGSFIRLPLRGWFTKATNINQEVEGPAVPDILVENEVDWLAKGTDAQLKRAVEELMKQLK
ncbi:MAG TPA: S41 family peptidase, partial [Saprospiraceae bacterium]|nr:S41 family peptidase [Saprospiraceae bacterium]